MQNCGIICEFNPLHMGHQYLLHHARELGAERVVCIMSGNAVQRGTLALADRHVRARAALECGADLVLELPFPWSGAGAQFFAGAGVAIASAFCDTLLFGSECGDLALLQSAAQASGTEAFRHRYEKLLEAGMGCAAAHRTALEESLGVSLCANDTLGVEYLRAMSDQNVQMQAITTTRLGSAYGEDALPQSGFASATALRKHYAEQGIDALRPYLPQPSFSLLQEAGKQSGLTDMERLSTAILAFFRLHTASDFAHIADADGGIADRICHAAQSARSLEELLSGIATKRYTDARLRRALLFCMTGVRMADLRHLPVYTHLLAANDAGRELLAQNRRTNTLPVLAKTADIPSHPYAPRQRELICRLDALFTLSLPMPQPAATDLLRAPYFSFAREK